MAARHPRPATTPKGDLDVVVAARREREDDLAVRVETAVRVTAPELDDAAVAHDAQVLQVVVDGLGLAVSVGRLRPDEAASLARAHVARLALTAPR